MAPPPDLTPAPQHPDWPRSRREFLRITGLGAASVVVGCRPEPEAKPIPPVVEAVEAPPAPHVAPEPAPTPLAPVSAHTELTRIEPGTFLMGADRLIVEEEHPQHRVRITSPFLIGTFAVLQIDYDRLMVRPDEAEPSDEPSSSPKSSSPSEGDDETAEDLALRLPASSVSWFDAVTFCNRLSEHAGLEPYYEIVERNQTTDVTIRGGSGFRLPTEAEWEFAARAGSQTSYPHGDDPGELSQFAWFGEGAVGQPHPVGQKEPNAWGLYDMLGNVAEWCGDWFGASYYAQSPTDDPTGPSSGVFRVLRGGSFLPAAPGVRVSVRERGFPTRGGRCHGFRVARSLRG